MRKEGETDGGGIFAFPLNGSGIGKRNTEGKDCERVLPPDRDRAQRGVEWRLKNGRSWEAKDECPKINSRRKEDVVGCEV